MIRILSILHRNRFDGVLIPDHSPQMSCAAPWHAGMAHHVGLHARRMMAIERTQISLQNESAHNERNCRRTNCYCRGNNERPLMLPMRANKQWAWENNWLPFSILSFAVFPWLIAWHTTPDIAAAYLHAHVIDILAALLCGTLAYTGSLLFGIAAVQIGVALSFSLLVGTMSAVGVMAPRLLLHHSLLGSAGDDFVLAGVCLSLVSVVFGFISSGERALLASISHPPLPTVRSVALSPSLEARCPGSCLPEWQCRGHIASSIPRLRSVAPSPHRHPMRSWPFSYWAAHFQTAPIASFSCGAKPPFATTRGTAAFSTG